MMNLLSEQFYYGPETAPKVMLIKQTNKLAGIVNNSTLKSSGLITVHGWESSLFK